MACLIDAPCGGAKHEDADGILRCVNGHNLGRNGLDMVLVAANPAQAEKLRGAGVKAVALSEHLPMGKTCGSCKRTDGGHSPQCSKSRGCPTCRRSRNDLRRLGHAPSCTYRTKSGRPKAEATCDGCQRAASEIARRGHTRACPKMRAQPRPLKAVAAIDAEIAARTGQITVLQTQITKLRLARRALVE